MRDDRLVEVEVEVLEKRQLLGPVQLVGIHGLLIEDREELVEDEAGETGLEIRDGGHEHLSRTSPGDPRLVLTAIAELCSLVGTSGVFDIGHEAAPDPHDAPADDPWAVEGEA